VFVLNLTYMSEAHATLEKLPLGLTGLMEFDRISLGPLRPLAVLLKRRIYNKLERDKRV